MFEQYANILQSEMPHLEFEGVTYPPPRINEILSNVVFVVRMVFLLILMAGPGVLQNIGIQNPPWIIVWAQENKVYICACENFAFFFTVCVVQYRSLYNTIQLFLMSGIFNFLV